MERRIVAVELRVAQENKLVGYAAVFDRRSQLLFNSFYEEIAPSAFTEVLAKNPDVKALWNHNPDFPMARTSNGTLLLQQDTTGLRVEIQPNDTSWGRDAYAAIARGDVDQMSFMFSVAKQGDEWKKLPDGKLLRRITNFESLGEVSPVTFPAYTQTRIGLRGDDLGDMPEIPVQGHTETRRRRMAVINCNLGR